MRSGWQNWPGAQIPHCKMLTRNEIRRTTGLLICRIPEASAGTGPRLQDLRLYGTQVTDAGLAHVIGLSHLQTLFLRKTKVTDAGLANLKGLTGLKWLYVWDSKVTDVGVRSLQQALPKCKIDHGDDVEPSYHPGSTRSSSDFTR